MIRMYNTCNSCIMSCCSDLNAPRRYHYYCGMVVRWWCGSSFMCHHTHTSSCGLCPCFVQYLLYTSRLLTLPLYTACSRCAIKLSRPPSLTATPPLPQQEPWPSAPQTRCPSPSPPPGIRPSQRRSKEQHHQAPSKIAPPPQSSPRRPDPPPTHRDAATTTTTSTAERCDSQRTRRRVGCSLVRCQLHASAARCGLLILLRLAMTMTHDATWVVV